MRLYFASVIISSLFLLASCENDVITGQNIEKNNLIQQETKEKQDNFKELSTEEVKTIVNENIKNQDQVMKELTEEYPEWWTQSWILQFENETKEFVEAQDIVKERLSSFVSNRALENYSRGYLVAYFCGCGGFDLLVSRNINVRFQIENQSKNQFEVSFISLSDVSGYSNPGTYILDFRKIDGTWKLVNERYIGAKKHPLNLTAEDIYAAFPNSNVKILDEVELNNNHYFIISENDLTYGINKKDSSINFDLFEVN